jgi:hypothetical protein
LTTLLGYSTRVLRRKKRNDRERRHSRASGAARQASRWGRRFLLRSRGRAGSLITEANGGWYIKL